METISVLAGDVLWPVALSSDAYDPEAALTLSHPRGVSGYRTHQLAIIGLLVIVFISYLQTIDAFHMEVQLRRRV